MRIGIDISQLAYPKTGVANYLRSLTEQLLAQDDKNDYVLFYSSLRQNLPDGKFWETINDSTRIITDETAHVKKIVLKQFKLPPTLLAFLWNTLHILPIENLIGPLDVFISSDWTQPPSKAKKITILYDLIVYTYPQETAKKIVHVQKKRLAWVKKEVDHILCISESTKEDAQRILGINKNKLSVIYPGL